MAPTFERLVRFRASDGQTYYGEVGSEWQVDLKGKEVQVFSGSDPFDSNFQVSDKKATISEVRNIFSRLCMSQRTDNIPGLVAASICAGRAWDRSQLPETRRRGRSRFYATHGLPSI